MIIAFYIPEELADAYRKERFQPTLARLKRYAKQAGTPTDLKIVRQLEASFCVSREIVNVTGGVPACLERDDNSRVIDELESENRMLKRALWLARASEASKEVNYWTCQDESSYAIVDFNVRHETIVSYKAPHHRPYKWILIWEYVENKCRAKAEEYK